MTLAGTQSVGCADKESAATLDGGVVQRILIVDDSRVQRKILSASLSRWGYQVLEAGSGTEAMAFCENEHVDLIISDWMMPGMTGLEFCQAFRGLSRESYVYFILLTSKSEKGEVAHGLEAGADDFLTKPVNANELRARIKAGERILKMERELMMKNRLVNSTLSEIQALYDSLDRDLIEARKLQQSLISERFRDFGAGQVSLLLRPSGHVGGDLVGFFKASETRVCLYGIDVSGHGVTSALMTARLAGYLSGTASDQNVALVRTEDGSYGVRAPSKVAEELNRLILEELDTEQYFTLVFADVDLSTGEIVLTQAGHPHPAVQRADGTIEFIGPGGLPVGLIPGASYQDFHVRLNSGDRLLLASDGITECPEPNGGMLDDEGLARILAKNEKIRGGSMLEALIWDLNTFAGGQDFPDDVSAVLFEFGIAD